MENTHQINGLSDPYLAFSFLLSTRLDFFIEKVFQHLKPNDSFSHNWLVSAMAYQLTRVQSGDLQRLIINVPPRHLKLICTSVAFPAFVLGRDPTATIILVCYSAELGEKMMRDLRSVMASDWYRRAFPKTHLKKNAATEITTGRGGGVNLTSVEGTLTVRGAGIIIVDDPIKAGDVKSDADRKRVNDWFQSTLFSRLDDKRTGSIVVAMQRLHEDDVTGHLTEDPDNTWSVVKVPAIATEQQTYQLMKRGLLVSHTHMPGEAIDPAREDLATLENIKRELGTLTFSAQYQQDPIAFEGNLVKRAWFKRYNAEDLPERFDAIIASWDTASGTNANNDFSVGTIWGRLGKKCYLLDLIRVRLEFPELLKRIKRVAEEKKVNLTLIENAASGIQLGQMLRKQICCKAIKPKGAKEDRLAACGAALEAGNVLIPHAADWVENFLNELTAFPNSKHDDQVDSLTLILNYLQSFRGTLIYDENNVAIRVRRSRGSIRGDRS